MTEVCDLSSRMKRYESVFYQTLPRRIPVILRLDGRAFHTLTHRLNLQGWDAVFAGWMALSACDVMSEMQGCRFAYVQSDEVSFLLTDYETIKTQPWFGYEVSKMISIAASSMSVYFSGFVNRVLQFDARVFSVPQDDVCNYFIWRQQDATRNAIQMLGQQHFSPSQLHGMSCENIQERLFQEKNINFNDCSIPQKRGICIVDDHLDREIPIFSQDRNYIEKHVFVRTD